MKLDSRYTRGFLIILLGFMAIQTQVWISPAMGKTAHPQRSELVRETRRFDMVSAAELPREAKLVLNLIREGGPFPYPKDGSIFGNRERRLPERARGYYREYTVKTPGRRDRGARRIIAGAGGEFYYTDDHYNSFKLIKE